MDVCAMSDRPLGFVIAIDRSVLPNLDTIAIDYDRALIAIAHLQLRVHHSAGVDRLIAEPRGLVSGLSMQRKQLDRIESQQIRFCFRICM